MEAKTNLSAQAEMITGRLMSDKRFADKVATTARTKHDGTFAINSDKEFYQLQMMLCDAFNALTGYSLGKPISEEETEIIAQCLTELHRLSNHEWLRMSGCFSRNPLAN
jgi:hypothetical protein